MRIDTFGLDDDICIKIYDPETKQVIETFNSYAQASRKLGLTQKVVRTSAGNKKRQYSPFLKKEVAIRLAALKKDS